MLQTVKKFVCHYVRRPVKKGLITTCNLARNENELELVLQALAFEE